MGSSLEKRTCSDCQRLIPFDETYYRVGGRPFCGRCFTAAGFVFGAPTPEVRDADLTAERDPEQVDQ